MSASQLQFRAAKASMPARVSLERAVHILGATAETHEPNPDLTETVQLTLPANLDVILDRIEAEYGFDPTFTVEAGLLAYMDSELIVEDAAAFADGNAFGVFPRTEIEDEYEVSASVTPETKVLLSSMSKELGTTEGRAAAWLLTAWVFHMSPEMDWLFKKRSASSH